MVLSFSSELPNPLSSMTTNTTIETQMGIRPTTMTTKDRSMIDSSSDPWTHLLARIRVAAGPGGMQELRRGCWAGTANPDSRSGVESTLPQQGLEAETRLAVVDHRLGVRKTMTGLLTDIHCLAELIRPHYHSSWRSERVLNLMPAGYGWMLVQFALWSLHSINVPQPTQSPIAELRHVIRSAEIRIGIGTEECLDTLNTLGLDSIIILSIDGGRVQSIYKKNEINRNSINNKTKEVGNESYQNHENYSIDQEEEEAHQRKNINRLNKEEQDGNQNDGAMILFTSGTTGAPKGVLITHKAISDQCIGLGEVWKFRSEDRVLHTHGIINGLALPLWYFCTIEFTPTVHFSASNIWNRILNTKQDIYEPISIFMGVPTMYSKLIKEIKSKYNLRLEEEEYDEEEDKKVKSIRLACRQFRLMISGSAPLSTKIKSDWYKLTGHVLLERYGMTETGMILSNPLDGIRYDGHVGFPIPGVSIRLRDTSTGEIIGDDELDRSGEIEVKGGSVFKGYWSVSEQRTVKEGYFTSDGYFPTGDIGMRSSIGLGSIKLLGRMSSDIIKSGGEKISALEIEQEIIKLKGVNEVSVIGIKDEEWGEIIGCVLVLEKDLKPSTYFFEKPNNNNNNNNNHDHDHDHDEQLILIELRKKLRCELARHKLPKLVKVYQNEIPKNLMGKVQKSKLARIAFPDRF